MLTAGPFASAKVAEGRIILRLIDNPSPRFFRRAYRLARSFFGKGKRPMVHKHGRFWWGDSYVFRAEYVAP